MIINASIHSHCLKSLERKGKCYRYVFEQFNPMITTTFNLFMPYITSTHASELPYLFDINLFISPWIKSKADRKVQEMITNMFCNFAKFGDPNGVPGTNEFDFKWEPITFEHPDQHLAIKAEPAMKNEANINRMERMSTLFEFLMK